MDQPHGFLVRPDDLKRAPMYYIPASEGVYGNDADSQTPIYLVPANAMRDSNWESNRVGGHSCRDLSSNLANVMGEPVLLGSAPGEYKYAPFGGRPVAVEIPGGNVASSDSMYGGNRAVPTVVYEPVQGVRQAHLPPSFGASPSTESNFLRPSYNEDQMWIPRQIRAQPSPYPTGRFRPSERFGPGRRQEVPQYYVPLNSERPYYGHSAPYHAAQGTGPAFSQPYIVDSSQDYVDHRHPSWNISAQRGRSNLEDGPVRGAREMQPVYTLAPGKDIDASSPYRPSDAYYLVRGPDSLPIASEGFDGGNAGIDRRPSEVPPRQASIVPVDFPVSDLAKVRSTGGDGHDSVYSKVFYDPTSGRILVQDPRLAPSSSSPYASTPSGAEAAPAKVGGKPAQRSNRFDEAYGRKEGHDIESQASSSRSGSGPSAPGFPVRYLLPIRGSSSDSDAFGGNEAAGSRTPNHSDFIPVYPSSTTSNNACTDDDKSSQISGPFYLVKPLAGSDKIQETSDDSDSQQSRVSLSNATVKDDGSARRANLERLSGSEKIKEVLEDGAASDKPSVVTRIIPVLFANEQDLPKKLENPEKKEAGGPEAAASSDHELGISKNAGNKESNEKSKSSEVTAIGNTKGTVRSAGKASKPKSDLMANIGKAFWSSKPQKEKRTVTDNVSGVDKSSSKQGHGDVEAQKRNPDVPDVGKSTLSQPSQSVSKSPLEAKSSDSETGSIVNADAPPALKPEAPVPVKPDALRSGTVDVAKSESNSATDDEKSPQESKKMLVDKDSKDRFAEIAGGGVVVVHPDLHPNFSATQEQEHAVNSSNTVGDGAAFERIDKGDAQVSSAERTASAQCDVTAQAGEALVGEAANSRESSQPELSGDGHDPVSLSPDRAATRIQARYKGHVVRQVDMLKSLRLIKKVQTKLQSLRSQVCTNEDVCNLLANPKERLKITESAMALLLELDTLQGVHPFVREMRKYVAQEIVEFQDWIDAVTKGELVLPSVDSSCIVAGSSKDTNEVLEDAETRYGIKEEQLDKAVASDSDTQSKPEVIEAVSGAGLHLVHPSETATTVDAPTMEVSELPWYTVAQTSTVEGTVAEATSSPRANTSSGALSGDESIVTSFVSDKPNDVQFASVDGDDPFAPSSPRTASVPSPVETVGIAPASPLAPSSPRTASVPSPVEIVGLAPDVEKLEAEENSVAPPRVDNLVQTIQEPAYLTGVSGEVDVNPTKREESTPEQSKELQGYDFGEDKVVDGVIADFALGGEDEAVTPVCDGEYDSGISNGDGAITKKMPVSLQSSVSDAGFCKDEEEGSSSVAELLPSSGNECEDVGMGQKPKSEPESETLSRGSPPPSEASIVVSGDDHGVKKASAEDGLVSGDEPSEAEVVKTDISQETPKVIIRDHSVEVPKVQMNNENAIIDLPAICPSRVEVGVQDSSASSTEESELIIRDDEVLLSSKDGVPSDDASNESVKVKDDADGALELRDTNCTETPQYSYEHPSKVEMAVHDTSPLTSEEAEVLLRADEVRLSKVDLNGHDVVPREVLPDEDDDDGVLKDPDEIQPDIDELSDEHQLGRGIIEVDVPSSQERTNLTNIDHDNVFLPPKVVVQEDAPEESSETLGEFSADEVFDPSAESPSGLDVGVHDSLSTVPIAAAEVELTDEDEIPSSCKEGRMHNGVSGESAEDTAMENADVATASIPERNESDISEPLGESSLGEELVGHDDPSHLPVVETASMEAPESLRESRGESEETMRESSSLSPEEIEVTSKNGLVIGSEGEGTIQNLLERDETTATQAAADSVEEVVASSSSSREACCSTSHDESTTPRGEFEPEVNPRRTSSDPEDRDALLKQLTEENKRLQALFTEVIQSNAEHKSTVRELLERLEKLEQLVKEQDQRKEKRKKKKINKH